MRFRSSETAPIAGLTVIFRIGQSTDSRGGCFRSLESAHDSVANRKISKPFRRSQLCGRRMAGLGPIGRFVRVYQVTKLLARLEIRNAFCRNLYLGACLGIPSDTGFALPDPEASESTNFDFV